MKKITPILYLICTFFSTSLFSQDVHFSHIHASPTFINPSMNGMINGGDIRFIANARSQWNSFTNGYKTIRGSVDGKLLRASAGVLNGGLEISADMAGDLKFATVSTNLSLGVSKALDRYSRQVVSLGLQAGYTANSMDYSKMVGFEEETFMYEGVPDRISYLDFSFGGSWFGTLPNDVPFYVGLSMSHLNKPDVSFFKDFDDNPLAGDVQYIPIFKKITVQAGMNIPTGGTISFMPSFMFSDQGPHQEILMGTFAKYKQRKGSKKAFYIGGWFRWYAESDVMGMDALVTSVRFDMNDTYYTFSYDVNMSSLARASHMKGGLELSVIKILETDRTVGKRSRVVCPIYF